MTMGFERGQLDEAEAQDPVAARPSGLDEVEVVAAVGPGLYCGRIAWCQFRGSTMAACSPLYLHEQLGAFALQQTPRLLDEVKLARRPRRPDVKDTQDCVPLVLCAGKGKFGG